MSNNQFRQKILEDLYALDPGLKKQEQELIRIINKLIESRPSSKLDRGFALRLRAEIMARAQELRNRKFSWSLFSPNSMKKFTYAAIGLTAVAFLLVSAAYFVNQGGSVKLSFGGGKISRLDNNAFGSLISGQSGQLSGEQEAQKDALAIGRGGGGGSATAPASSTGVNAEGGMMMPAPDAVNYQYVYKGDDFVVEETQMAVYKRIKDQSAGRQMANLVSGINTGLIDLNRFHDTAIGNLNINEDRNYGYTVYFDFINNLVSLNAYWEKWPRPEVECQTQKNEEAQRCYDELRLKISDLPSDQELIALADGFIKEYKINMDNYGAGEVDDTGTRLYQASPDNETAYVPEIISVTYPLMINGQTVEDESGNPYGITVDINIRYKRVYGLRGLTPQNYASSNYQIETDSQKIIKLAEKGGVYASWNNPYASKTVEIELGTPALGLVVRWQYDYNKNDSTELYVPAYIFPVLNEPEDYLSRDNIVVPLPREIIAEIENRNNDIIGVPQPEPLMMEESAEAPAVDDAERAANE